MPSPESDGSQTPDRKASASTLSNAFKQLLGGRTKPNLPPSSPAAAKLTPPNVSDPTRWNGSSGSLNGHANGALKNDKQNLTRRSTMVAQAAGVMGGSVELNIGLKSLASSRPQSERIAAIDKICPLLRDYPIANLLHVWETAKDMIDPGSSEESSRAGYTLLATCCTLPDIAPSERDAFFWAISTEDDQRSVDLRIQALRALTAEGRNVETMEVTVAPLIIRALDEAFETASKARRKRRSNKSDSPLIEDSNFDSIFQFITNLTKFNSKVYQDTDIERLIDVVVVICGKTGKESDLEQSIGIFDVLITYTHIPHQSLKPCIEVLGNVYCQLASLQDQTWRALREMFRSHIGQSSVAALLEILHENPTHPVPKKEVIRGAVKVLQRLVELDGNDDLPTVSLSLVLPALKAALAVDSLRLPADVMQLVHNVLTDTLLTKTLLAEDDWTDLCEIFVICSGKYMDLYKQHKKDSRTTSSSVTSSNSGRLENGKSPGRETEATLAELLPQIINRLDDLLTKMDYVQKSTVMDLFLKPGIRLSNAAALSLLDHYIDEHRLHPSSEDWLTDTQRLVEVLLADQNRPAALRLKLLSTVEESYRTVEAVADRGAAQSLALMVLDTVTAEQDAAVLKALVDFAVTIAEWASEAFFDTIVDYLRSATNDWRCAPATPNRGKPNSLAATFSNNEADILESQCLIVTTGLVRIFIRIINKSARKASVLFYLLRQISEDEDNPSDARVIAFKFLLRLRSDANHAVFIIPASEGQTMAAILCRTEDTATQEQRPEDTPYHTGRNSDFSPNTREPSRSGGGSPHVSLVRPSYRNTGGSRMNRPVPPLWMYPGPRGLPEEPPAKASPFLYSHIDLVTGSPTGMRGEFHIALWLEEGVIKMLQNNTDWEVYSYILVHLGAQLANQALFSGAIREVKMLRNVLCEQARSASFFEPPAYTSLKKADVAVCIFHILTMLISYHDHFEKSEQDDLVRVFVHGIGGFERTSKWAIHALTVCCHEIPISVSRFLEQIVQKMSQVVTQPHLAVHILEFLTGLARQPELYRNFREDEYKMVFGVSFRYLQYARDQHERTVGSQVPSRSGASSLRHSGLSRESSISDIGSRAREKSAADDLPQYVHTLAYHVITFWFMALKKDDRKDYIPWITKNLRYRDRAGNEIMEEQAEVVIDMMQRTSETDCPETARDEDFADSTDGEVLEETWIVGMSLVTIQTAARTGKTQKITRRPSSTRYDSMGPQVTRPPAHQVPLLTGLDAETFYTSSFRAVLPGDIFQSLYSPIYSMLSHDALVPLPPDDIVKRAISSFDRSDTVDGHKVGVIYIGAQQTDETSVFANVMGSPDYTAFVSELGTIVRLKGSKMNMQGLDREFDTDGEFAYAWRDRVTEVVYHVTTMMPTNLEHDPQCSNKKRHTGNDFVNIIFNNSGLPFKFDMFPSAFNYVYIVITPEARLSFIDTRGLNNANHMDKHFYKVQVLTKPGFPEISPAAEAKVLSGKSLASYVRLLALNASVFSLVWSTREGGEYISPWRNRLREIKRLRERYCPKDTDRMNGYSNPSSPTNTKDPEKGGYITSSTPLAKNGNHADGRQSVRESFGPFKRTSIATLRSEGTSRSSLQNLASSQEMERQGSREGEKDEGGRGGVWKHE